MRSLAISIFLYAYESGNFTAELEKGRQAFEDEMLPKAPKQFIRQDNKTDKEVQRKIQVATEEYDAPGKEMETQFFKSEKR